MRDVKFTFSLDCKLVRLPPSSEISFASSPFILPPQSSPTSLFSPALSKPPKRDRLHGKAIRRMSPGHYVNAETRHGEKKCVEQTDGMRSAQLEQLSSYSAALLMVHV